VEAMHFTLHNVDYLLLYSFKLIQTAYNAF